MAGRTKPRMLNQLLNTVDRGTTAFSANKFDPSVPFQGRQPVYKEAEQSSYTVSELNNGFTVLTESESFPGTVNMGKWPFHAQHPLLPPVALQVFY